jgi:hypothetical protein
MQLIRRCENQNEPAGFGLVTKGDLAKQLKLSVRGIEKLVQRKAIPIIRLSPRCVRFHLPSVLAALRKFEVMEAGRRRF